MLEIARLTAGLSSIRTPLAICSSTSCSNVTESKNSTIRWFSEAQAIAHGVGLAADGAAPALSPDDAFAALVDGRVVVDLADGLQLRRSRVMHADRIELLGFTEAMRERLKADGLFSEIVSWKLRLFVPTGAEGLAVLGRLFARWPVAGVTERSA